MDAANVKSVQQENSTFEDYLEIFSEYRSICVIRSGLWILRLTLNCLYTLLFNSCVMVLIHKVLHFESFLLQRTEVHELIRSRLKKSRSKI